MERILSIVFLARVKAADQRKIRGLAACKVYKNKQWGLRARYFFHCRAFGFLV